MSFFLKNELTFYQENEKENNFSKTLTSGFKSVGRSTHANWANRFARESNDLSYNINFHQIKGKGDLADVHRRSQLQQRYTLSQWRQKNGGTSSKKDYDKSYFRQLLMNMNKVQNPEKFNIVEADRYSTFNTQGLCKYEFEKTIAGRLKYGQFNHLNFSNQVSRKASSSLDNISSQIDHCPRNKWSKTLNVFNLKSQGRSRVNKCHSFASYIPHKVFEPRPQIDKFYQIEQSLAKTKPRTIKQTAKIQQLSKSQIKYNLNSNSINVRKIQFTEQMRNYVKFIKRRLIGQSLMKASKVKHFGLETKG